MTKIYSVCMNKGGVGKTTLATSLASVISIENPESRVLLIDMDGQGNCAYAYGLKGADFEYTMYDVMTGDTGINQTIVPLDHNLFLAPSNNDMNFVDIDIWTNLSEYPDPTALLNNKIAAVRESYDFIVIDTPPAMGLVATNVFSIEENNILIPFNPESFAVWGLINVINAVEDLRKTTNGSLRIAGIVGLSVKSTVNVHTNLMKDARQYCAEHDIPFLDTVVPHTVRFVNATETDRKPAVYTDKSKAVRTYYEIWEELSADGSGK